MDISALSSINPDTVTPEQCRMLITALLQLASQYEASQEELQRAVEQINSLRRSLFGSKREKTTQACKDALSFFDLYPEIFGKTGDEAASEDAPPAVKEITERKPARRKKQAEGTARFPADLPREEIIHDLPEEERVCPECGSQMKPMGTDTYERLRFVPAEVVIEKHIVKSYACDKCRASDTAESVPVKRAPEPRNAVPGSFAAPESIAYLAAEKYQMGTPLYRLEKRLEMNGILLSRQTMANWLIQASFNCLKPLTDRLHEYLISYDILHADETPLQVLREDGKSAKSKSYVWLYATGTGAPFPIVLYDYQPDRKGNRPREFLEGFSGWLQTDGYSGYKSMPPGVTGVGCAAHARRKFWDAVQAQPEARRSGSLAMQGLQFYDALFELEREFAGLSYAARKDARDEKARPVLEELHKWLLAQHAGKSKLGTAIQYSLSEWNRLMRYLDDGRIDISNNYAERCIKPFVIGRKNWLFSNTPDGARASAFYYSIIETAKANGVDPYRYLVWIFRQFPQQLNRDDESVDLFLPWNAPPETRCLTSPAAGSVPDNVPQEN